jgi:hypothetical protein
VTCITGRRFLGWVVFWWAGSGWRADIADPPRNGEGHQRSWWRGHRRFPLPVRWRTADSRLEMRSLSIRRCANLACPSTTLRVPPPPRWGEDRFRPLPPIPDIPARPTTSSASHIANKRNGGRHRCQPPLSGILPVAARLPHPGPPLLRSAARKTTLAARSGAIRRWFGRPPFGGRPHLESPSSSLLASAEAVAAQAMDCISYPARVRLNSWESRRSVIRYRSTSSSIRPVFLRLVLQPAFLSRRSVVSVVR